MKDNDLRLTIKVPYFLDGTVQNPQKKSIMFACVGCLNRHDWEKETAGCVNRHSVDK